MEVEVLKMRKYGFMSGFLLLFAASSAQASNLVINGGFEAPALAFQTWANELSIPGWVLASGQNIEIQNYAAGNPYEGNQLLELDGLDEISIYQDIPTVAGTQYQISFAFSARPNLTALGLTDNLMGILWDGTSLGTVSASGVGLTQTDWTVYTYRAIASSTTTRLQLSGLGHSDGLGEYVDAVSVSQSQSQIEVFNTTVPEPSTMMICLGGLLCVAANFRKRVVRS